MADDTFDWRLPGQQVQLLQGDVRELRRVLAEFRREVTIWFDRVDLRMDRIEMEMRLGFRKVDERLQAMEGSVDARFDQMAQTMATNFQVLLVAIEKR